MAKVFDKIDSCLKFILFETFIMKSVVLITTWLIT